MKKTLLILSTLLAALFTFGQTSVFTSQIPVATTVTVDAPVTLGMKFRSTTAGSATGVRFYKVSGMTGTHTGLIYSSGGSTLGTVVFSGETSSGWQTATFSPAVTIAANTTYVIAYYNALGAYLHDGAYFTSSATTNGVLSGLKEGTDGSNGVYTYGGSAAFPSSTYNSTNYWVDVIFSATVSANAGVDQTVTLPGSSTTLDGTGSTGATTYSWTKISGPNTPTIVSATSSTTSVTGLIAGTYVFQLSINSGASTDQVSVTVASASNITTTKMPDDTVDFLAPGRGAEEWNGKNQWDGSTYTKINGHTHGLNYYYRFNWVDIAGSSVIDSFYWTKFDSQIQYAIDNGMMFSFGVMPICDGACNLPNPSYPAYLHTLMQGEATNSKDWHYTGGGNDIWVPNWNSPNYLARYKALLMAIAAHINSTTYSGKNYRDVIYYVDVRGYGEFGEWHTYPWYGTEPTGRTATTPTLDSLIQYNKDAFPNFWNVLPIAVFDGGNASITPPAVTYFALNITNTKGLFGWRRDNWGDPGYDAILQGNGGSYNPGSGTENFDTAIMNRYIYAPIVGEPTADQTAALGGCGSVYCDLVRELELYGGVSFGNGNYPGVTTNITNNITAGSRVAGYRLAINNGTVTAPIAPGGSMALMLNWQNIGISPTYEPWTVTFTLKNSGGTTVWTGNSSFTPQFFLSGTVAITDNFTLTGVTVGTYKLYVTIVDATGYKAPLPLAINGRDGSGSYLLSNTIVVSNISSCNCIVKPRNAVIVIR